MPCPPVAVPLVPPDIDVPPPDPEQPARIIAPASTKDDARRLREPTRLPTCVYMHPELFLVHPLLSEKISSRRMVSVTVAPAPRFVRATASAFAVAFAVAVTIFLAAREGHARTAVVLAQLDYTAAPGCPAVDDFEAIVSGRLGYRPSAPTRRTG